nr:uncharacterized protein LOC128704651 [Cherax quadricarinatus]XP_053655737.1 uncharacterized protein LOC128704651 [Cherax quadricarinatus]XP_053655738.1 uncharacterized protein LOC128704651 [Cherax quadricarinatus]XP_053655739.1 uncharacterized protein LOC128704651 [Cherax quadricarinatus]XP_053655740.1 uncharacterized protein LOC128704651 [Cherax quadricarinatus]
MEVKSSENLQYGVETNVEEEVGVVQCSATPQPTRRPLQQIHLPVSSSPMSQSSATPYKYHKCQMIPEEQEGQENLDPRKIRQRSKKSHLTNSTRCLCCISSCSCIMNLTSATSSAGSDHEPAESTRFRGTSSDETGESSPFAYPLIWESQHGSTLSSTHSPSSLKNTPPSEESPKSNIGGRGRYPCTGKGTPNTENNFPDEPIVERGPDKEGSRAKKVRNGSGSSGENSVSKHHSHQCLNITPSKSSLTPSPSDRSVFRTPSERFSSTKSNECRGPQTPQQRRILNHHSINPFEVGAECLQLPTVSPSLFRHVVSPSQKVDGKFRWSIDQLALLHPVNIETSPFNQADVVIDPDYERQAQDAIDKFFTHHTVASSPWTGSEKAVNLLRMLCTPVQSAASHPVSHTNTVWCQTELSLPPVLPEAVEEALRPFCTFTQEQWWQGSTENDEGTNINNTTLRRKLLFSHDELLNVTPMCSPGGGDASGVGSPPSSVDPLPLHRDDQSPERVHVDDDKGLMWCTAVVAPDFIGSSRKDPQLARHPPPSPSVCSPPTLMQRVSPSYIAALLPGDTDGALQLLSPDLSPIEGHENSMASKHPRLHPSPDVSPIHVVHHGSDSGHENVCSSSSSFLNPVLHGHSQAINQIPNMSPTHLSTELQVSPSKAGKHFSPVDKPFPNVLTTDVSLLGNDKLLHKEPQKSPITGTLASLQHPCHQKPCTVSELETNDVETQASKEDTGMLDLNRKGPESELEVVTCSSQDALLKSPGSLICKENFNPATEADFTNAIQDSAVMSMNKKCDNLERCSPERLQKSGEALDVTMGFTISEENAADPQETSGKTSPVAELRTSSNSGHFSSSPIRGACQSPLEVETPNRRFSDSPPLSPILCRSLMFQGHSARPVSPRKLQHDHPTKRDTLGVLQSTFFCDDTGTNCTDELMDDGHSDAAAVEQRLNPIILARLSSRVPLVRSSSICDMETDSQPSIEINGNEEGQLQDTGYQTGSLHTTNFNMTTYNQDNNYSSNTIPPPQTEHLGRFVNSSYIQGNSAITKISRNGYTVTLGKNISQ